MGATNSSGQLTTYQNGGVAPTQANVEKALREDSLNRQKANDLEAEIKRHKAMAPPPPSAPYLSNPNATPKNSTPHSALDIPSFGGPFGKSFDIGSVISSYRPYHVEMGSSGTPVTIYDQSPSTPNPRPPSTILRPQPFTGDSRMAGRAFQLND